MTIEDVYEYRDRFYAWVWSGCKLLWHTLRNTIAWLIHKYHALRVRYRAYHIKQVSDLTMGDKLRTLAGKFDAIDEYWDKYCNEEKVCRVDTYKPKRNFNKMKNDLKKELLILLHGY